MKNTQSNPYEIVNLVFMNADAKPKNLLLKIDLASVAVVMSWYYAYHYGDRYTVAVNGRNVPMDKNGEPVNGIPT